MAGVPSVCISMHARPLKALLKKPVGNHLFHYNKGFSYFGSAGRAMAKSDVH